MHVRVNKLQTKGGKKHQGDMKTFNNQHSAKKCLYSLLAQMYDDLKVVSNPLRFNMTLVQQIEVTWRR